MGRRNILQLAIAGLILSLFLQVVEGGGDATTHDTAATDSHATTADAHDTSHGTGHAHACYGPCAV
jgi:hypothetical protein